jgi:hypothetical protein
MTKKATTEENTKIESAIDEMAELEIFTMLKKVSMIVYKSRIPNSESNFIIHRRIYDELWEAKAIGHYLIKEFYNAIKHEKAHKNDFCIEIEDVADNKIYIWESKSGKYFFDVQDISDEIYDDEI